MADLSFSDVVDGAEVTENGALFPLSENWTQGRTAFGGYSAAVLLEAALRSQPRLPPLRSALINFTGPITAPPLVRTELLRQGRNVTTVNSRAEVDAKTAALGTFSFGQAQTSHVAYECPAKPSPAPSDTESYLPPNMPRIPARFLGNFDIKLIEGHRPFVGADRGYVRAWARHRDVAARGTITGLMALADMLPPAVFSMCSKLGPNSSMTWICNFLTDDLSTQDGWYMLESDLTIARDGYSSQVMRIWNSDGDLICDGMQSVIIFV